MTENNLDLHYTVSTCCLAEASLGKPLASIFEELQSEEGASLKTLRALVAAGRVHKFPGYAIANHMGGMLQQCFDEVAAGKLIEKHGLDAVASQVGLALGAFIAKLTGKRP